MLPEGQIAGQAACRNPFCRLTAHRNLCYRRLCWPIHRALLLPPSFTALAWKPSIAHQDLSTLTPSAQTILSDSSNAANSRHHRDR